MFHTEGGENKIMTIAEQNDLVYLIYQYNNVDSTIVKKNIIRLIDNSEYHKNIPILAKELNVNVNTIYGWRQPQRKLNVSFESALKLVYVLGVSVTELMER